MNSKIRVEYDFDKKEPYIQLYLEKETTGEIDLRDSMLQHFVQRSENGKIIVTYPSTNVNNKTPQLRFVLDGETQYDRVGEIQSQLIQAVQLLAYAAQIIREPDKYPNPNNTLVSIQMFLEKAKV